MALRTKGETVDEIEGLARTMLEFASPVAAPEPVIDTCGTGGDRSGTFNISTVAAIVVAGAGVPVAKHGNRAASSHCGSADLLEALGVTIDLDAARRRAVPGARSGSAFMFAPRLPPRDGARRARSAASSASRPSSTSSARSSNPARPYAQVVGVSDERMLPLMAEVLARRGVRAKLFRGEDGLDELTTTGISAVYDVQERLGPRDAPGPGCRRARRARRPEDLAGGDAEASAAIAARDPRGRARSAPRRGPAERRRRAGGGGLRGRPARGDGDGGAFDRRRRRRCGRSPAGSRSRRGGERVASARR